MLLSPPKPRVREPWWGGKANSEHLRRSRGAPLKRVGTVVIPVFIDESEDADHALSNSAFEPVWQVLKALRAHDEELAEELDELRLKLGKRSPYGGKIRMPEKIKVDVPTLLLEDFEQAFYVRTVEQTTRKPPLTEEQTLAWADEWHERTGKWPTRDSGLIPNTLNETWAAVDGALKVGTRGLPGGSSLAKLLAEHLGVRNTKNLPVWTEGQILALMDVRHEETGRWPRVKSGPIKNTPGETWANINQTLVKGGRGLPGGSSLAKLLFKYRGVRNNKDLPPLSLDLILAWADAHLERTGQWPTHKAGPIPEAPGETWRTVDKPLRTARRGFPVRSSLAQVLAEHRAVRNIRKLPQLSMEQILAWADAHHARTGRWPTANSGGVAETPGETWANIDQALTKGLRGLPGGSSLARLLAKYRDVPNRKRQPKLCVDQILAWADAHRERTGKWPRRNSGPIAHAPGEIWVNVDQALVKGLRGLPGGSSLARLLAKHEIGVTALWMLIDSGLFR